MTVLDLRPAGPGSGALKVKGHFPLWRNGTSASGRDAFEAGLRAHCLPVQQAVIDEDSQLARAARALLAEVAIDLAGAPFAVVLRDDKGGVIDRKGAGAWLSPIGASSVTAGCAEGPVMATNANDTAPQRAAGVAEGAEQFATLLTAVARAAVPVHDRRNGHVIGALEMSSPVQGAKTLVIALARRVAKEIEERLLDEVGTGDKAILYHFLRERHRAKGPFVFLNGRTMVPNAGADRLLGPSDEGLLRHCAEVLAERSYEGPPR